MAWNNGLFLALDTLGLLVDTMVTARTFSSLALELPAYMLLAIKMGWYLAS
jgi:hypothetical protein